MSYKKGRIKAENNSESFEARIAYIRLKWQFSFEKIDIKILLNLMLIKICFWYVVYKYCIFYMGKVAKVNIFQKINNLNAN